MRDQGDLEGAAKGRGLSRRQVVKAGVWAAPVIVLATASPASAGSLGTVAITAMNGTFTGTGPYNYSVDITASNTGPGQANFSLGISVGGGQITNLSATSVSFSINGGDVQTKTVTFTVGNTGSKTFTATPPTGTQAWTYGPSASKTFKGGASFVWP